MENQKSGLFSDLAKGAGKQTLFRVSLRGLINLIAISDRKANILLSINTILITMVVSMGGFTLTQSAAHLDQILLLSLPAVILLIFGLVSSLLAIYATAPKAFRKHDESHPGILLLLRKNLDIDLYISQISSILKSNESIYKSMSTDLYSVSDHLEYKNRLLRRAYMVFFVGILTTVICFAIIWFMVLGMHMVD